MEEDKIKEFQQVVGADEETAREYIDQAHGDVDQAIANFFDHHSETTQPRPPSPPKPSLPSGWGKKKEKPRVASLSDLQNQDEDESDEEAQNFFAGGKASGVALQGPPSKKPVQSAIEDLLKTARETGAREPPQPEKKKPKTFHGAGFRLGDSEGPSNPEVVPGSPNDEEEMEELEYLLTFWQDGFSVDDGPLRNYKDPANEEFLKTLALGMAPKELRAKANQPVKINVKHRVEEKYIAPKKVLKPFTGQGHRLGSEVPGETVPFQSSPNPVQTPSPIVSPPPLQPTPMDPSLPQTSIQIRLADGTRMVIKFGLNQTIQELYQFVAMSRPEGREFVLMTTFPNKELLDKSLTIQGAGLLNSSIVQKYK